MPCLGEGSERHLTNEELVAEIQAGINVQDNMAALYQQNRPLMIDIAYPFTGFGEMDDLLQEAYFGLERAVRGFNPTLGFKFMTYAESGIRQSMRQYCQKNGRLNRVPPALLERISKYQEYRSNILAATGEEPDDASYMALLGISVEKLKELRKYMEPNVPISFESPIPGTDDLCIADTIPDEFDLEGSVVEAIAKQQAKTAIWDAVDELPARYHEIIEGEFRRGEPLHVAADRLNISVERVRKLRCRAQRLLRDNWKIIEAAKVYDYGSSQLYHWGISRFAQTHTSSVEYIAMKHLELEDSRKQLVDRGRQLNTTVPVIVHRIRQTTGGYTPVGVAKLNELNAYVEQMVQECQEYKKNQRKKKADSNKKATETP